jgi:hypothetical protein
MVVFLLIDLEFLWNNKAVLQVNIYEKKKTGFPEHYFQVNLFKSFIKN